MIGGLQGFGFQQDGDWREKTSAEWDEEKAVQGDAHAHAMWKKNRLAAYDQRQLKYRVRVSNQGEAQKAPYPVGFVFF